jgi:single-strand DNA-binding protein
MEQQPKRQLIPTREHQEGDFGSHIAFVGNLGRDPEMTYSPNGLAVTKFSVAVWQGKGKESMWLNCTAFGELAEEAAEKLVRGGGKSKQVRVSGRLTCYKALDGRQIFGVNVNDIVIITREPVVVNVQVTEDDIQFSEQMNKEIPF